MARRGAVRIPVLALGLATAASLTRFAYAQDPATAPQLRPPFSGPTVQLLTDHLRTTRLQQQAALAWTDVCASPCGIAVDPNAVYRLGGAALSPTDPFRLPRASGAVRITGSMSSSARYHAGVGLSIAGGAAALISAVCLISAENGESQGGTTGFFFPDRHPLQTFGIVTAVVAGLLLVVGLPLATIKSTAEIQ